MESTVLDHEVETLKSEFDDLTENPEIYIEQQFDRSRKFKELSRKIYNLTVTTNKFTNLKNKALVKLLIEGFDEEQIWQQIEIQNKSALEHFSEIIHRINPKDISFAIRQNLSSSTSARNQNKDSDDESNTKEGYAFDDDSDSDQNIGNTIQDRQSDEDSNHGEQYAFDDDSVSSAEMIRALRRKPINNDETVNYDDLRAVEDNVKPFKNQSAVPKKKTSVSYRSRVDDQFFKLSKLEEFLRIEDLKEQTKGDSENFDEDDGIDLFQDIPSDVNDDSTIDSDYENETDKKSSKDFMYEDFFDVPDSGDESVAYEDDEADSNEDEKNDLFEDAAFPDKDIDSALKGEDTADKENGSKVLAAETQKSAFEMDQEKVRKQIQEYEKSLLQPAPWHLTGEVAASNRPKDSLIEYEAEFESNTRQELLVDNTLTEKVENIIKMAIMNKAFSDVERKVKPTDEVIAYKKDIALEQTKSKKSLAQVYEEDYLKKQTKQEEGEDPKHKEIKKLMDSLFPELHALFSHIPKPAIPEIKIISNLPAITVEEVAPTSVSDVTLLAPEEVKRKSGLVKGNTERTDTDRKRERRKKKIHQRLKEKKNKEKLEQQKARNPNAKISKLEKVEALKKLKKNKNTKLASIDDGGKIKSSKDFFSRLQDTVDAKEKTKNQNPSKKRKI